MSTYIKSVSTSSVADKLLTWLESLEVAHLKRSIAYLGTSVENWWLGTFVWLWLHDILSQLVTWRCEMTQSRQVKCSLSRCENLGVGSKSLVLWHWSLQSSQTGFIKHFPSNQSASQGAFHLQNIEVQEKNATALASNRFHYGHVCEKKSTR